ncbi:hypothetical protein H6G91_17180 [Nostoc muscorum FACHB-395]|nr:hypothetical protein [Desmonostoc muscorum FACHB-395]
MRVRLAAQVAAKVEGIKALLSYPSLSDTTNLLLDAIRGQWCLNLANLSQIGTEETRIRLADRHRDWITQYGHDRGINVSAVVNLVLSEYLSGLNVQIKPIAPITTPPSLSQTQTPSITTQPVQDTQQDTQPKPKGKALLGGLRL